MNNVSNDDINTILQSKTFEFLGNDGTDSLAIGETLKNFNSGSSNILKGEAWDKVRNKYGQYDSILAKHSSISSEMTSSIKGIMSELQSAMDGYDSIDISKLEELKQQKRTCESKISEIQGKMNEKRFDIKSFKFVPVYDNASLSASLAEEQKILDELNKLIAVVENIKAICTRAESTLNNLLEDLNTICSGIEDINPSNQVAFQA